MRIKFLSIIASFFMVSFLITSCLNDDTEINYSPDATIHAFALDTIGYGKTYKFTIDQNNHLIYNEDSLPVHADTIIDRILIKTLTTASGIVTMKSKEGQDSIININDSIDLRPYVNKKTDEYLQIKVWAPDMQEAHTRTYRIGIRKHLYDPDSLGWNYRGNTSIPQGGIEQKSVLLESNMITYAVEGSALKAYKISADPAPITTAITGPIDVNESSSIFDNQLPTSIIAYKSKLYATSSNLNGKVYESTNGIDWEESTSLFNGKKVVMLLAPLNDRITYITEIDDKKYFNSTANVTPARGVVADLQAVPEDFPTKNFSYTSYTTGTNVPGIMLVGDYETQPTVVNSTEETIVPWGYMGNSWQPFPPNNVATSCPGLEHPSIIYYNSKFYIFGSGFNAFYVSDAGIAWNKANYKFSFPNYAGWGASPTPLYSPEETPEFRGREIYSAVLDPATAYIWISFSKGTATFTEKVTTTDKTRETSEVTQTYPYESEVWRGRLTQLWFDIENSKITN